MANIIEYTKNVAKSITYSAVDRIEKINPVLSEFADSNETLSKNLYAAIKDYKGTIKKTKDWVIKSDIYEAADEGFHAVIEDIRSGKFYNKERIDDLFAIKSIKDFESALHSMVVTRAEKYAIMGFIRKGNFNDYNKVRAVEDYTKLQV